MVEFNLANFRNFIFLISTLLVYVAISFSPQVVAIRTQQLKWDVRYDHRSPDCYKKVAITINGEFPGPTITAFEGETVSVEITNSLLTENIAIHWHGIRQKGKVWVDGTESITQCAIQPGDKFVYEFVLDRAGTYMYHAHYGMQMGTGLYGMILVKLPLEVSEPFLYNFEHHILLTDWYHKSTYEHTIDLTSVPMVWVGEPESILIHGRGKFNCSTPGIEHGLCNATNPQCSPHSITVKPNQIIRLRIGSLTTLSTLSFEIEDHVMIVVEADGSYVHPFETKHLYIYSGETYSVLIKTKPTSLRNYWISAKVVSRESQTPKGLAILNYSPNPPLQNPPTNPPYGPLWNNIKDRIIQSRQYRSHIDYIVPPPKTSDKVIILLNTQNKVNGGVRWSLNNVSLNLPHTPYLIALKENLTNAFDDKTSPPEIHPDYENYDIYSVAKNKEATTSNAIYRLKFNSVVDVILQNANTMTKNVSETHPWHLHGHDFWVLGYGEGKFDLSRDPAENYNLKNPIMKNTVALHPYGWTALRFRADNPGVWVFHCHIEYHYALGMAVVFESGVDQLPELPNSIKGCGLTKGNYKP